MISGAWSSAPRTEGTVTCCRRDRVATETVVCGPLASLPPTLCEGSHRRARARVGRAAAGKVGGMTVALDPADYRRAVGRFATGVTVVTTVLPSGELHALTCNSFTSVSLDPLLALFCAEKVARFHDAVLESGSWAVSVLATRHEGQSRHFARRGRDLARQFDGVPTVPGPLTGAPVLAGALAAVECRTVSTTDAGDHTVVLGEVLGTTVPDPDGEPLVYFEGGYRNIA